MWALIFGCLALTVAQDVPDASYFITYSSYLERGMPFNVNIDILNTTDSVLVHAEIQRVWNNYTQFYRKTVTMTKGSFSKGKTGTLTMKIPNDLISGTFKLHVRGSGGLQFERESSVSLKQKAISILVQTDKAIYKPGQLVHFRAFAVYPNLKVYNGKFDITLQDPNQNTLKEWIGLDSTTGVVAGEFQLADKAVLGDWKLHVEAEEQVVTESKTFTVDQYQLPRFEVTVDLPSYALTSNPMLHGTVKAKYTFGKPVKGMVELHAHLDTSYDNCGRPPKYVELAFPTDGDTKFDIPLSDLKRLTSYLEGRTIVIDAIVKEELTGIRLTGSSSVKFYEHPYKIEVLKSSPGYFSPKLPYTAFVKVSQQDGRPVTDTTSPVMVNPCVHYTYVQGDQGMYSCSSFTGTYGLPPKNYSIPASGIIPVDMDIPENTTSINVKDHSVYYMDLQTEVDCARLFRAIHTVCYLATAASQHR